jgi:hypothetical protein
MVFPFEYYITHLGKYIKTCVSAVQILSYGYLVILQIMTSTARHFKFGLKSGLTVMQSHKTSMLSSKRSIIVKYGGRHGSDLWVNESMYRDQIKKKAVGYSPAKDQY